MELLSLRSEIALIDTRIIQLLEPLRSDEFSTEQILIALFEDDEKIALRDQDEVRLRAAENNMRPSVEKLNQTCKSVDWDKINHLIDLRRKLVESEQKRQVAMRQMITLQEGGALMHAIISIIREEVTDINILRRVAERIGELNERVERR